MKYIINIAALVILANAACFGQVKFTKHQLGINASKFVLIFNEQVDNLDLTYRVSIDTTVGFRTSVTMDLSSADDAINDFSIRMGFDRIFLQTGNWKFYSGMDANYSTNTLKSSDRTSRKYGGLAFLGFLYHFGPHFSISTEPSLALFYNTTRDKSNFNPDVNKSSSSLEFINIGQIRVSFHF